MGGGIASVGPTPKKVLAEHPVFNSVKCNQFTVYLIILALLGYTEQSFWLSNHRKLTGCVAVVSYSIMMVVKFHS